jgi:hypothetical protein
MNLTKTLLATLLLSLAAALPCHAQNVAENPGDYMTAISKARGDMDVKYMQYVSAVAHGRRARKVEKLRQQVLENITQCRYNTTDLPLYKGDNSLRKGSIDYIQLCYDVFNEDYAKVVNMEELAEQSFDEMQAYILLQDKISQKLDEASANLEKVNRAFAAKYNVNLITEKTPLSEKLETAGKLNTYMNKVYLVFFKCNWEDGLMVKAMNEKKVNDVEQARSALLRYANEGLSGLDSLRNFAGDPSLANSCKEALQFYKKAAENEVPKLTDFFLKEEDFEKLKKAFNDKPASDRSKDDVNAYNKSVKDINQSVGAFNQTNQNLNNSRNQMLNNWSETQKRFADEHMPEYK